MTNRKRRRVTGEAGDGRHEVGCKQQEGDERRQNLDCSDSQLSKLKTNLQKQDHCYLADGTRMTFATHERITSAWRIIIHK